MNSITHNTPARLGFRMPAEWMPHHAVWLAWPWNELHFEDLEHMQHDWLAMVEVLVESELVHILVPNQKARAEIHHQLQTRGCNLQRIYLHTRDYQDVWLRDTGPTFLTQPQPTSLPLASPRPKTVYHAKQAAINWIFNGWGGAFPDTVADDQLASWVAAMAKVPIFEPGIETEGGAIETNGECTLITTDDVLLHGRNKHLNRRLTDAYLREFLGVQQVIWLPGSMQDDDTGGHVDNIARFTAKNRILAARVSPEHPDYEGLEVNYAILSASKTTDGKPIQVQPLPMPEMSDQLPSFANYANFYISNRVVLVPAFGQTKKDAEARQLIQTHFPKHKAISIESRAFLSGGGAIHCLTQQQP